MEIKNPTPMWWSGDHRVEPFMHKVSAAIDKAGLTGQARTDVYNRAYEAVYAAIKQYGDNVLLNRKENPHDK